MMHIASQLSQGCPEACMPYEANVMRLGTESREASEAHGRHPVDLLPVSPHSPPWGPPAAMRCTRPASVAALRTAVPRVAPAPRPAAPCIALNRLPSSRPSPSITRSPFASRVPVRAFHATPRARASVVLPTAGSSVAPTIEAVPSALLLLGAAAALVWVTAEEQASAAELWSKGNPAIGPICLSSSLALARALIARLRWAWHRRAELWRNVRAVHPARGAAAARSRGNWRSQGCVASL